VLLLALETTSAHGSVAIFRDEALIAEQPLEPSLYSTQLFTALEQLSAAAQCKLKDVDVFAAANGPGSFTGVRVGLATVKGLVEVWRRPAVAVSTLAAAASAESLESAVLLGLDASRAEVYCGAYPNGALAFALQPRGNGEEGLESLEAFAERARGWRGVIALSASLLHGAEGILRGTPPVQTIAPVLARGVGRLGLALARAGRTQTALELDANYIRRSDAELFSLPRHTAERSRS
jgi:tRNA threonylcarbamoyladenosine biosynthesis protein TsaB